MLQGYTGCADNPINLQEHVVLEGYNTFGLKAKARYFVRVSTDAALGTALAFARDNGLPVVPLGAGSNVILPSDLTALVIQVDFRGRTIVDSSETHYCVEVGAGEHWHGFVHWSLTQQAFGLENLALIPGTVGAAPIQNIGAYGVELQDRLHALTAVAVSSGEVVRFTRDDCQFGYRDSIFKQARRDQFIITSVQFTLDKVFNPQMDYGTLRALVQSRMGERAPTAWEISDIVCTLRRSKLPDPAVLGNVGSFFKNPIVDCHTLTQLKRQYPDIVAFPINEIDATNKHEPCRWKLAAGWLIETAGLKGYRLGAVSTYPQQALVLVNQGGATYAEVVALANTIQKSVYKRFGVMLEHEPRIY